MRPALAFAWPAVMRLAFASLVAAAACAPPPLPPQTVSLRMRGAPEAAPADATVYIDDQLVGQLDYVEAHGVALPAGVHHITIKAPGYFPVDKEVEAKKGDAESRTPIVFDVKMLKIPD